MKRQLMRFPKRLLLKMKITCRFQFISRSLSNRAACYLKLEKLQECVEDCTKALYILEQLEQNNQDVYSTDAIQKRKRLLLRRGTALYQMGQVEMAILDYEKILELDPSDSQVLNDLDKMRISV